MKTFRSFTLFSLLAGLASAQSAPVKPGDPLSLEAMVVSAGPDAKSSFDLAQGTSVLTGDELRRRVAATLGETLSDTPGVSSSYYGPGASRPVIRGLGGDRIRVLESGVGALDASNISPDHNTALEPLFASRIEVLRGPSTLLYGSSAVGGVVNVVDNRIPDSPGDGAAHGTVESRFGGAADERTGVVAVKAGSAGYAIQVNALRQKTGDADIPGVARIDAAAPVDQPAGTLPGSALDTKSGSVGATAFGSAGRFGVALSQYETVYGVPTGDDPPVSINLKQTRVDLSGEITQPFGVFRGAKARFDVGRYQHSELDGPDVATTFKNKAWEGRLELPHVALGDVTGTIGLQGAFSDFSAVGEEVVTPPSRTHTAAVFALEELKRPGVTYQFGARYEHESIRLGDVDPSLPALPGYAATSGQQRSFDGASGSLGLVVYPAPDYSLGLSLAYSERLPTAQELFSNGPHGGTGAYEVGTSRLGRESSLGLDVSLRKRAGFVTGTINLFANRFNDYIFEQELPAGSIPTANNPEDLTPYQFIAQDALFYGAESELQFHLQDRADYQLHVSLLGDYVHAESLSDHQPLPRIPPLRLGIAIAFENARWSAGADLRHAFRQDRFGRNETATAASTRLNARVSFRFSRRETTQTELFLAGENLTDAIARVSTSFLKDFAPLPGRGVTAGLRVSF